MSQTSFSADHFRPIAIAGARSGVEVSARQSKRASVPSAVICLWADVYTALGWKRGDRVSLWEGTGAAAGTVRLQKAAKAGLNVRQLYACGTKGNTRHLNVSLPWPSYRVTFPGVEAVYEIGETPDGPYVDVRMPAVQFARNETVPPARSKPLPPPPPAPSGVISEGAQAAIDPAGAAARTEAEAHAGADGWPPLAPVLAAKGRLTGSPARYLGAFLDSARLSDRALMSLHKTEVAQTSVNSYVFAVRTALKGTGWTIEREEGGWRFQPGEVKLLRHGARAGRTTVPKVTVRERPSRAGEHARPAPVTPPRVKPSGVPAHEAGTCAYLVPGASGIAPCGAPASGTYCEHHKRVSAGVATDVRA
ncbi:MAG: hypothetical protein IPK75_01480 [Acidobacteria bacterium]|nr:hypothetical protein [Acidobacteriota bacterium]